MAEKITEKGQDKQSEWYKQWSQFSDSFTEERALFLDWISPNTLDTFAGKSVLEGGCGSGHHTEIVAPVAKSVTSVDLNTTPLARERNKKFQNVEFLEADLAAMNLEKKFDVVFSIGVIHHTDDPDQSVRNLVTHLKPGGRLILWVYSHEGNFLVRTAVEGLRKAILEQSSRETVMTVSRIMTALIYPPVFTVYLLPLKFLPFYEYFANFRKLSFRRNLLNVFDKLNAPQVQFITKERAASWVPETQFKDISIQPYRGVSWCVSATLRGES